MKRILIVAVVVCNVMACANGTSVETGADTGTEIIEEQTYSTRDSVTKKADTNQQIIDSTFKVLRDSIAAQ